MTQIPPTTVYAMEAQTARNQQAAEAADRADADDDRAGDDQDDAVVAAEGERCGATQQDGSRCQRPADSCPYHA